MSAVSLASSFESPEGYGGLAQLNELAAKLQVEIMGATVESEPLLSAHRRLTDFFNLAVQRARFADVLVLRTISHVLADAAWALWLRSSGLITRVELASALAEAAKWDAVGRFRASPEVWRGLGELIAHEIDRGVTVFAGDVESVGQSYLRALAYHSAAFDVLDDECAWQAIPFVEVCVPFLDLSRRVLTGPHYIVDPLRAPVPVRCIDVSGHLMFRLSTAAACERLVELQSSVVGNPADAGAQRASVLALRHLQRVWAIDAPLRRHRRHSLSGELLVAQGFPACLHLLSGSASVAASAWSILDISRSSMAISMPSPVSSNPLLGELVGLRFQDASQVQLGLVRRFQADSHRVVCGLQVISRAATIATVEDGRASLTALVCDPVLRGEAVRLIISEPGPLIEQSLFLKAGAAVFRLRALDVSWCGQGFEMRTYQLL